MIKALLLVPVRDSGGWITRAIWEHPLYRAAHDLENRLGIRQDEYAPEDAVSTDPLVDDVMTIAGAAQLKD